MLRRANLVPALLLTLATSALAQLPGGMQMPNVEYNPLLLINASVQKELHLTPANAAKVQNAFMDEAMKIMPLVTGAGPKGTQPLSATERSKRMMAGVNHMQTRLAAMLTPTQRVRLRQLTLQSIGPSAVLQPRVANELSLSSGQRSKLEVLLSEANSGLAGVSLQGKSPQDFQTRMKVIGKLQQEAKTKGERALLQTFNASQRTKWRSMLGKPFPLSGFLGVGSSLPMGG